MILDDGCLTEVPYGGPRGSRGFLTHQISTPGLGTPEVVFLYFSKVD